MLRYDNLCKNPFICIFSDSNFSKNMWPFKPKILALCYGVYNICGHNIYNYNSIKDGGLLNGYIVVICNDKM